MAVDSSFYNDNWTILNKLIYLEKFMMENDIELESLSISVADNGDITLSGENIKGETITQTVSGADVAKASNLTALAQKALVLPDNAPASEEIVTIGTNGEQSSLSVGDGLSIENGALKASGGGGGGGLYLHHITMYDSDLLSMLSFMFYSSRNTAFLSSNELLFAFELQDIPVISPDGYIGPIASNNLMTKINVLDSYNLIISYLNSSAVKTSYTVDVSSLIFNDSVTTL